MEIQFASADEAGTLNVTDTGRLAQSLPGIFTRVLLYVFLRRRLYRAVGMPLRMFRRRRVSSRSFRFLQLCLVPLHMVEMMSGENCGC